jgi:virginiamycin B lyase
MRSRCQLLALAGAFLSLGTICYGATVTGTVKGPDGTPFEGAFVQARNIKNRITTMVLSDKQGHYRIENLPAGDYRVQIKAVGYRADPRAGVTLTGDQGASFDFALQKSPVRWNEISIYQAKRLWPASPGKDKVFARCFICHGFQTRMASVIRDAEGWEDRVQYMRDSMWFSLSWRFTDQDAALVSSYLTQLYGPDSILPKSPEQMPQYKETVPTFGSDAMNIVYVEYEMPGPNRMPFSAAPDDKGYVWIPNFGAANKITRLDPKTGEMTDFPVPNVGTAAVHSAYPAPDGSVWLTEQGSNKLGRWDPVTQKITEYQDKYLPGKEGTEDGGSRHTVRFDPNGNAWSSGFPLSRFDPETKTFKDFSEAPHTYSLTTDKDGNIWYSNPGTGQIGRVDWKTLQVKQWTPPTPNGYERRINIDANGIVWFGEYQNGKIGRFDPKTETFKEYPLPGGRDNFPYALALGSNQGVWYASYYRDVIGRLDPNTGNLVEYPFPHSENTIREFFLDSQGRMWYGSPSNNVVGYFYLAGKAGESGASASAKK